MSEPINVFEYAPFLLKQLPKGMLVNVKADGTENTMTIGWGTIGIEWSRNILTIYVRNTRYTHTLLEKTDCFTVSSPIESSDPKEVAKILAVCGSRSGRDINKFEFCGLETVPGQKVSSPAIKQLPLTIECRILERIKQDPSGLPKSIRDSMYASGDYHIAYYGEIVDAYILDQD